ncbi:MAG: hypothetical protein PHS46_08030 [Candidatus Omnitrophica bacterium]|nr:hypothetical protein [Candidatus Omnitrophota bacterium]
MKLRMSALPLIAAALIGVATERGPDRALHGVVNMACETDRLQTKTGQVNGMGELNPIITEDNRDCIFRVRALIEDDICRTESKTLKAVYAAVTIANVCRNDAEMKKQGLEPVFGYRKEWQF